VRGRGERPGLRAIERARESESEGARKRERESERAGKRASERESEQARERAKERESQRAREREKEREREREREKARERAPYINQATVQKPGAHKRKRETDRSANQAQLTKRI
jgi:RNA-binding motif X-linked protein 2